MKKNIVIPFAAAALLAGCCCPCASKPGSVFGNWGIKISYPEMNAGHLILTEKDCPNTGDALMLWRWGSPMNIPEVVVDGDSFTMKQGFWKPQGKENDKSAWRRDCWEGRVCGDKLCGQFYKLDGNGQRVAGEDATFTGWRNQPMCAAPNLAKARYGEPVDMLKDGLDGWQKMSEQGDFGWTFTDGVLSNRVKQNEKGQWVGHGINLMSKRADFFDFNLKYEVRVPKGANSGVYLRGRYEIQTIDSYGQTVDCHHMAALYGRITPSVAAEKAPGEWQTVDVTLYKRHVTVILNGRKIIDNQPVEGVTGGAIDADETVPGPLYIQGDHSDADYRNMVLTPIL